jgi:Caudovirus prohead protease.
MIRAESFAATTEDFAAARRKVLTDAEEAIRPFVKEALDRLGLPSWEYGIVNHAKDLFTEMATAEVDAWGQVLDDLRDAFAHELGEALKQTKTAANREAQLNTITGWVVSMAHNAAMEAAATSDTSTEVGLEWVTMSDADVRSAHAAASGQTVPSGQEFSVGGEKVLYPGQPVGDPANWINCRCVARPTMIGDFTAATLTAAADPQDGDISTTCVIVALPADSDPVSAASSEADGAHCTLLFLGDTAALDQAALATALEQFVTEGQVGVVTDKVNGSAVLGSNKADVVLLDAANLKAIYTGLLGMDELAQAFDSVEQYPTWIPHVTLGYPETPRLADYLGEAITFDRLALWFGEDRTAVYPLGETMPAEAPKSLPEKLRLNDEYAAHSVKEPDAPAAPAPAEPAAPAPAAEAPAADVPIADKPAENLRPWHGVLAPEGSPSGDKRKFAERMLTTRDLPLSIKAMFADGEGHEGSVVVARIDAVYRDGGLIKAEGVWDDTPDANRAYDLVEKKMWRGVSVDLDAAEGEMVEASEDGGQPSIEFTQGRISAATLCAIPAFAEAFVRNGTWADFANEPMPTGAMVPIPDWPGDAAPQETAPAFSLVASAAPTISADYFRNPMLTDVTPVTRGEDGHIFGHLGIWEQCHIAYEVCTTVPPSETDYAYFLTGQVFTDAGPVAVGQLTVGGGHADMKLGVRAAIAHYDNVASAVADITVGEDEFGVWFSGRIRPWATERQIHELFAAGPSGDWRGVRYRGRDSMEMIAAHAVNVPGFPVERPRPRFAMEGTRQVSLVAAGMPHKETVTLTERLQTVNAIKASIRAQRFADLKTNLITTMKGH